MRPRLVPEYWVYGSDADGPEMSITAGIADAVAFDDDGRISGSGLEERVNLRERQIRMYRELDCTLRRPGRESDSSCSSSGHIETLAGRLKQSSWSSRRS